MDRKEVVVFLTAIETSELYEIKIIALLCQTFLYNRIIFQFFSLIINEIIFIFRMHNFKRYGKFNLYIL